MALNFWPNSAVTQVRFQVATAAPDLRKYRNADQLLVNDYSLFIITASSFVMPNDI